MSGVVALTLVCQAPKYGQELFGVESDNLNKRENCKSVKLVKPPTLDKCRPSCFFQIVWGGHALYLMTLPFSDCWRVH